MAESENRKFFKPNECFTYVSLENIVQQKLDYDGSAKPICSVIEEWEFNCNWEQIFWNWDDEGVF